MAGKSDLIFQSGFMAILCWLAKKPGRNYHPGSLSLDGYQFGAITPPTDWRVTCMSFKRIAVAQLGEVVLDNSIS